MGNSSGSVSQPYTIDTVLRSLYHPPRLTLHTCDNVKLNLGALTPVKRREIYRQICVADLHNNRMKTLDSLLLGLLIDIGVRVTCGLRLLDVSLLEQESLRPRTSSDNCGLWLPRTLASLSASSAHFY